MQRPWRVAGALGVLVLAASGRTGGAASFVLTSPAFAPDAVIPVAHTCDAEDRSPPLVWAEPPAGTRSFALVCEDPDAPAGLWVHWVLADLPATARALPAGVAPTARRDDGSRQGRNDFARTGYNGPCPPRGKPHRYVFRLFALDTVLDLPPDATRAALLQAAAGHVLGVAELPGRYGRQ